MRDKRTAAKVKRIQQVKRQKTIIMIVTILLLVAVFIYIGRSCGKQEEEQVLETGNIIKTDETEEPKTVKEVPVKKEETAEERLKRVGDEAKASGYPEGVIELLSKNPETVDFVEAYPEKKDNEPAKEISELQEGKIPHMLQWDERWGYAPYGTSIVAVSGCGPTCLSMVISGLTGDKTLTPAKMAEYGTEHHYINEDNDTYWIFMSEASSEWGITSREKMLDEEQLKNELLAGHPVICSVGPGDFTQIGHFIVLVGWEDDKVIVHDPFSIKNTEKRWVYEDFKDQIKSMWTYSMEE